jgi:hypothetical protein
MFVPSRWSEHSFISAAACLTAIHLYACDIISADAADQLRNGITAYCEAFVVKSGFTSIELKRSPVVLRIMWANALLLPRFAGT